jgi:GNAT superfamily N-acetyltransferase
MEGTLDGKGKCVFALFENDRLIGFAAVFTWRGDPTGQSGVLAMDYIEPTYRGHGLSRPLYQGRIDWALDQAQLARLVTQLRYDLRKMKAVCRHEAAPSISRIIRVSWILMPAILVLPGITGKAIF